MLKSTLQITPVLALALLVSGCAMEGFEPYYADQADPEVTSLSVESEPGNIGGTELTINGSGFGDSLDDVLVTIGRHNVEILAVSDSAITVITPPGPITGGAVDIIVGTPSGYTELEDAYTYDITVLSGEDIYEGQTAYILAYNMWLSCYMGLYENPAYTDCGTLSYGWYGESGVDAKSEWFTFAYPRVHTPDHGSAGGADLSFNEWFFTDNFNADIPRGIDDLRVRVGDFTLTNPDWEGDSMQVDLACETRADDPSKCKDDDVQSRDMGVMDFCETTFDPRFGDYNAGGSYTYQADWPLRHNFWSAKEDNDQADHFASVDVVLDAPGAGVEGAEITLPPPAFIMGGTGFQDGDLWALSFLEDCNDVDDDGQATLLDDGMELMWEPIPEDVDLSAGDVTAVATHVTVSVSMLHFGFFGGEGWQLHGSITVPDDYGYDEATGMSKVMIPNWVLYQFPSPNLQWSNWNDLTMQGVLGSWQSDAAYMLIEIYRITDYRIETDDGEVVVFSYVTGDASFPGWSNPIADGDSCSNCLDDDGDGWTDDRDPDCNDDYNGGVDEVEDGASDGTYTCNDGIDNDGNGLIDAEDTEWCNNGWDGETNCGDGDDNDGDGWIDLLDADCLADLVSGQEDGAEDAKYTCSDGLDNDGDGWIDSQDPGCLDGTDDEVDGFDTTLACNDGVDNDDHGDADDLDPYCSTVGGFGESEQPSFISRCADDSDNDDDGFMDGLDPDCEYGTYRAEFTAYHTPDETEPDTTPHPLVTECYDGTDNDMDGAIDAADSSCWNPYYGYMADGFLASEGLDWGTDCSDGLDLDGDGWFDGADPDCVVGDETQQTELGFGTTQCNDGIDNDGDGFIDADDEQCTHAGKNIEQY